MGTGIVSTLTQLIAGHTSIGATLARVFLLFGWLAMTLFAVGFAARVARDRSAWSDAVHGVGASAWGMVAMGVLSVGSATNSVLSAWSPVLARFALAIDGVCWILGTVLGLRTTFGYAFALLKHRPNEPRPAWGLAVVPPMVTATTGTAFVPAIDSTPLAFTLVTFLSGCFVASLTLAAIIFWAAYHHHRMVEPIPTQLAVSAWIPLGPVGQSTAAAQVIGVQAEPFLTPSAVRAAHLFADVYGIVMMTLAIPLTALAITLTVRGLRGGMRFSPSWWAMTFPVGTLSLGTYYLGYALPGYGVASVAIWAFLLATWTICALATARVWWPRKLPGHTARLG